MRLSIARAATALTVVLAGLAVPATAAQAAPCKVKPRPGQSAVIVQGTPTTAPPQVGKLKAGERVKAKCTTTQGGAYQACGYKSKLWVKISRPGLQGWVRWRCVVRVPAA